MKKTILIVCLLAAATTAYADSVTDIPGVSPAKMCNILGSEAVMIAKARVDGFTEVQMNQGIASKPVQTQADEDFEVRMTRMVYRVFHDDRFQRGVAPDLIGSMVEDECYDRLPVTTSSGGDQ
jgi:hypothetical protein